jgi:ATP-binding cassette subfamily F protein 3
LRDFLGSFNFSGEMATSKIAPFSGGEKARLALALIIWQKPNLLLLDEPTNHLDLETRHALTMALAQFEGTLILVSHDRALLRATTDIFMLVAKHRLQPFDGDLDDYRDWLLQHAAETRAAAKEASASPDGMQDLGVNRKEQRRQEAQERQKLSHLKKPLQSRIAKIEKEMDALNTEKAALDTYVADPASYEPAAKAKLTESIRRQADVNARLEALEHEWLEAHEELEQIG